MPDFQPVKPGDRFEPKAFEFNAMLEAGRRVAGVGGSQPAETLGNLNPAPSVVRVKNTSGGDRGRYSVLSLGPARWALDSDKQITATTFEAAAYAADSWPCVLQSALKADAIGFAVILGATLVKVGSGGSAGELYGTPNASYELEPGNTGPVYIPGGTAAAGVKLGVVAGRAVASDAIIDLRVSGNLLQYTKNGSTWTTWHTGTNCPP
jgi:hypothetical protein